MVSRIQRLRVEVEPKWQQRPDVISLRVSVQTEREKYEYQRIVANADFESMFSQMMRFITQDIANLVIKTEDEIT